MLHAAQNMSGMSLYKLIHSKISFYLFSKIEGDNLMELTSSYNDINVDQCLYYFSNTFPFNPSWHYCYFLLQ